MTRGEVSRGSLLTGLHAATALLTTGSAPGRRLPPPACPWATVLVQAEGDAYIDSASEHLLRNSWHERWTRSALPAPRCEFPPASCVDEYGVETAWVRGGHVTSFFTEHAAFRVKMVAALQRMRHPMSVQI